MWFKLLINILLFASVKSATIGLLLNVPSLSNHIMYRSITRKLAERGHKLILITTDPTTEEKNHENTTVIDIHEKSYEVWREKLANITTANGIASNMDQQMFRKLWVDVVISLAGVQLNIPAVKRTLNDTQIDILIGSLAIATNTAIAKKLNVPYIGIHPSDTSFGFHYIYGNSYSPYYYADTFNVDMRHPFTWEGIGDIMKILAERRLADDGFKRSSRLMLEEFGMDLTEAEYMKLIENIALPILTVSQLWSIQKPVQLNTLFVGDTHMKQSKLLEKDLEQWLDEATEGVVLFSLGTNVRTATLPPNRVQMLVDTFSGLPYKVLLKWNGPLPPGLGNNTRASPWLEQFAVLAHPNTKVFVTQGGLLSINEAIFNTVPLIAIPFFGDQEFNSKRIVDLGLGKRLFFSQLTSENLRDAIIDVANDTDVMRRMVKFSGELFDTPLDPVADCIWWIEHVLKHQNTDHLRAEKIPFYEYVLLDVIFFVIICVFSTVFMFVYICSYFKFKKIK